MKIEITKKPNSPSFPYAVGDIVTVSEEEGKRYIRLGIAKEIKEALVLKSGGKVEIKKDVFPEIKTNFDSVEKLSKKKKAVKIEGEVDEED